MTLVEKISKSYLQKLKNKAWYHQRFDGSPMYLFAIGEAEIRQEKRKQAGTEADLRVCFFNSGQADWYLDMADVKRGAKVIINQARKNQNISAQLLKNWKEDEDKFEEFSNEFHKVNLKKLINEKLLKLFDQYSKLFLNRFSSSAVIDHFALGTDEIIAKMIRVEIGKIKKESDFNDIFSVVTATVHQSFINQAEIDLLKITINSPNNLEKIKKYKRKYFWTKNNYITAQILTVEHFQKEISVWRKSKADLKEQLNQFKNTPHMNKLKKQKLFREHRFSSLLKTLIKISEDFTWWQDERKRSTYLNIHMGTQILGEMADRIGYTKESTKFLIRPEVKKWFKYKIPNQKELNQRMKNCGIAIWRDGYYIALGKEVAELKKLMLTKSGQDVAQDLRGLSASTGRVIGKVRIINSAREISKVKPGDILVAVMTRPDYIAGMKKAAAIVTNEGGITCHAAIVSRELGIPCIIGTKIATQVFKDGDLVEVNANHGVVKKISVHK